MDGKVCDDHKQGRFPYFTILNNQLGVDTSIELRVVRDLGILTPHDLTSVGDETKITHVHLDYSSLCDHSHLCVEWRLRVLLHGKNVKLEGSLEIGVDNMSLAVTESTRADESLILRRLSSETITNESDLLHHSLPGLGLSLTSTNDLEHFGLGDGSHLGDRYIPFTSLLLSLLLHSVTQYLGTRNTLTIEKISGNGTSLDGILILVLVVTLFMRLDSLFHRSLFRVALLVQKLGTETMDLLGELRSLMSGSRLLFAAVRGKRRIVV